MKECASGQVEWVQVLRGGVEGGGPRTRPAMGLMASRQVHQGSVMLRANVLVTKAQSGLFQPPAAGE